MVTVGQILCTRDGRKVNNSIILEVGKSSEGISLVRIETTFGDEIILPLDNLPLYFHINPDLYVEPKEWRENRLINIFNLKKAVHLSEEKEETEQ
jgi:hypothetical protein